MEHPLSKKHYKLIVTCEHASNLIPTEYQSLFTDNASLLESHYAYDIGAAEVAENLQKLADYFFVAKYSRLLIDLNRSLRHPRVFSAVTRQLPADKKKYIINHYYLPYRNKIENLISDLHQKNHFIIHISVHSFTP